MKIKHIKHNTRNKKLFGIFSTPYTLYSTPPRKRGYVLAFAVLVGSILISIGLGMFNIAIKEVVLSSSGRESQLAFYAADSGGECAVYWDIRHPNFSSSVFATSSQSVIPSSGVSCAGKDITSDWTVVTGAGSGITTFNINLSNGSCTTVVVTKQSNTTKIESRGLNTCNTSNPRRLERGLRINY